MAFQISRLYDFQPGTKALSGQVDDEFNQLVDAHNQFDQFVDTFLAKLASTDGAKEIGAKGGKTLDKAVLSEDIPYIRLNDDKVIETSTDGVTWEATSPKGDKGDKGEPGKDGIISNIGSNNYALQISDSGYLELFYVDGTTPPNLEIDNEGCLILTI